MGHQGAEPVARLLYARVSSAERDTALQIRGLEAAGCEHIQVQELPLRRQLRGNCPVPALSKAHLPCFSGASVACGSASTCGMYGFHAGVNGPWVGTLVQLLPGGTSGVRHISCQATCCGRFW